MTVESIYSSTNIQFKLIFADIASPPSVKSYLEEQESKRNNFVHLRFDEFISRQSARIEAMKLVDSHFVVFIDNNMLCETGWLENLLQAQKETGAHVVSPIILTQGGEIHFSAGLVERKKTRHFWKRSLVRRPHHQPGIPRLSNIKDVQPVQVDIDFAESHCSLIQTECLHLNGVLIEEMHNAQTVAYATYYLKFNHGKRLILEPSAVVSIVPIGFGYDFPWICSCYMDLSMLESSYRRFEALIGKGPGTDANLSLAWHAKHLKYLLLSMLENNRLYREDYLMLSEVPDEIISYDKELAKDTDLRIKNSILPFIEAKYPDLLESIEPWLKESPPQISKTQNLFS